MWAEIRTTSDVLDKLASEPIERFLNSLREDAVQLSQEMLNIEMTIGNLVDEDSKRLELLSKKIDESIKIAERSSAQTGKPNTSESEFDALEELRSLQTDVSLASADLFSARLDLLRDVLNIMRIGAPLKSFQDLGRPSSDEKRGYLVEVFKEAISHFDPTSISSIASIASTMLEWKNHHLKFEEGIERVALLVRYWGWMAFMKEEGIIKLRSLIEKRKEQLQVARTLVDEAEGLYGKLAVLLSKPN